MSCDLKKEKIHCPVCGMESNAPAERCPRCGTMLWKTCENCTGCSILSIAKPKKTVCE